MSAYTSNDAGRSGVATIDNRIGDDVIEEEVESETDDALGRADTESEDAAQLEKGREVRELGNAMTGIQIGENALEQDGGSDADECVYGPGNEHEEAARNDHFKRIREQRAAMASSFLTEDGPFASQMKTKTSDVRNTSKISTVNAPQPEQSQSVVACTCENSENCGCGFDSSLMGYYNLRAQGLIPARDYDEWESDSPERKALFETQRPAKIKFEKMKWDKEYRGRGSKSHYNISGLLTDFATIV